MENQATKKGIILLVGVVIGLLTGVLVTFTMVSKLNQKSREEENPPRQEAVASTSDTIYKYIVHRYEPDDEQMAVEAAPDSLSVDSLYMDEQYADLMLDDDEERVYTEIPSASVSADRMVSREEAPILYFDAGKNPVKAPENAPKFLEVQFWSTPIRNKVVYTFNGSVLKIKGLKSEDVYVIHYNDHYYLQCEKRVYPIESGGEYQRLTEIRTESFM